MNNKQRPLWIIIFAILLASIAIRSKGQGLSDDQGPQEHVQVSEIQIGDQIHVIEKTKANGSSDIVSGAGRPVRKPSVSSTRPKYAFVSAEIAQFDSDTDPDGWLAKVILMDADDQPVVVRRATAKFELMPRLPTHDFTGYVNANVKPITWSVPLKFSEDRTATTRLKLRNPLSPLAGWSAASHPAVGASGGFYSPRRGIIRHTSATYDARTAATDRQRRGGAIDAIGLASFGQLKVRVSIPGEGVFDAVAPIQLRPTVLVDTRWPYQ